MERERRVGKGRGREKEGKGEEPALPIKKSFPHSCMVMVRIVRVTFKVSISVKRVGVRVSVNRVRVRMGMQNSACHVYLSILDGK